MCFSFHIYFEQPPAIRVDIIDETLSSAATFQSNLINSGTEWMSKRISINHYITEKPNQSHSNYDKFKQVKTMNQSGDLPHLS
jgi:hypothetical protein